MSMDVWFILNMISGGKSKTRKCSICEHFVAQIAHQIDRQSHNSGILHDYSMSMDVWEFD